MVELIEIIAGVRDLPRFVAKPPNCLQDGLEILGFLRLRVRVVVSKVCFATVVSSVTKIDEDSLGMTNVEVAIRFRGESSPNLTPSCRKVYFS